MPFSTDNLTYNPITKKVESAPTSDANVKLSPEQISALSPNLISAISNNGNVAYDLPNYTAPVFRGGITTDADAVASAAAQEISQAEIKTKIAAEEAAKAIEQAPSPNSGPNTPGYVNMTANPTYKPPNPANTSIGNGLTTDAN